MARYFIEVSYLGNRYSGFQVQDDVATIQSAVEQALRTFYRVDFELTGSSRTDAGVHAHSNFFHFDTDLDLQGKAVYNLNALLPHDISVKAIYGVKPDAHCRFDAMGRAYNYFIYNRKNPFLHERAYYYPFPVQLEKLQACAAVLPEYRDFEAFSKRNTQVRTFQCTIELAEWRLTDEGYCFHVQANRFLRGMVRGLVGTMLKVQKSTDPVANFRAIIERGDCTQADFAVPGHGLYLTHVYYPDGLLHVL